MTYKEIKQAECGPRRRHIKGSKIAEGLQSAKVLVNRGPFDEKIFEKNLTMPKKLKGGTLWDLSTSIVAKLKKLKGLWGYFFRKKCPTMPKNSR